MYHIVYLTTNKVNNKIYVGVHSSYNLDDGYLGSGIRLCKAITKYGKENFNKQILYYCLNKNDAYEIEKQIVNKSFINNQNTYNMNLGGCHNHIEKHKLETRIKMSISQSKPRPWQKNRKYSKESKQKISNSIKKWSENNLQKTTIAYKLISPCNSEYILYGRSKLRNFCKDNNLNGNLFLESINKGTIEKPEKNKYYKNNTINSIGWVIQTISISNFSLTAQDKIQV